jgi:hypothetical protein
VISSLAKDFSSVRVNGGRPRRIDSVTLGIDIFKDGDSDLLDSVVVESNRLVNSSVRRPDVTVD